MPILKRSTKMRYTITDNLLKEVNNIFQELGTDAIQIGKLPVEIFFGVAYADAKIDKKEIRAFTKILVDPGSHGNPLMDKCLNAWLNLDDNIFVRAMSNPNVPVITGTDKIRVQIENLQERYEKFGAQTGSEELLDCIESSVRLINNLDHPHDEYYKHSLLKIAIDVASASGGILGIGNKISASENAFITELKNIFKSPKRFISYKFAFQTISESLCFREDITFLDKQEYNNQYQSYDICKRALEDNEWLSLIDNNDIVFRLEWDALSTSDLQELVKDYTVEIEKRNALREKHRHLSDEEYDLQIDDIKEEIEKL